MCGLSRRRQTTPPRDRGALRGCPLARHDVWRRGTVDVERPVGAWHDIVYIQRTHRWLSAQNCHWVDASAFQTTRNSFDQGDCPCQNPRSSGRRRPTTATCSSGTRFLVRRAKRKPKHVQIVLVLHPGSCPIIELASRRRRWDPTFTSEWSFHILLLPAKISYCKVLSRF